MGNAEASPQRICKVCGHANSSLSLFCAECGSVLNGGTDPDMSSATTSSPTASPSEPDTQQTQAFSPGMVTPGDEQWAAPASSDPTATAPFQPLSKSAAPLTPPSPNGRDAETSTATAAAIPAATTAPDVWPSTSQNIEILEEEEPPESLRGFFFGVVAFILILIVAAVFTWTILPDGGLRDTIQGWLNAIPF